MGVRLRYAKVIDQYLFYSQGGRVHPGLSNKIVVNEEAGRAGAFLVLRGWGDGHGTFTEQWRIEARGGAIVYESVPRELHIATTEHVERLQDEVADLVLDDAADGYRAIFSIDERVVARVELEVRAEVGGSTPTEPQA
ncbi:MAG: hypothetical protein H0V97_10410 [Actinobacteria bacterium]|nr:hypothetical protein [Actinomycetota bacterium]